jgi:hypothetical protein
MNLHRLVLLAPLIALVSTAPAQTTPAIFPFEPAQVLGVLPAAPAEWKVTRSEADTTLGEWLETRATRVFQAPPTRSTTATSAPGEAEISVVDTAGFEPALAAFAGFVPGRSGDLEKKLIGSSPAIVITSENGRQFTQLLISSRYLVEITLTNLPQHRAEDWLRLFRFDSLPAKSRTQTNAPREFRLSHVDELQPRNNRSYTASTTSAKRVNDFLKTLPPEPPDPAANATP